jgi:hypothetical protein
MSEMASRIHEFRLNGNDQMSLTRFHEIGL